VILAKVGSDSHVLAQFSQVSIYALKSNWCTRFANSQRVCFLSCECPGHDFPVDTKKSSNISVRM